MTGVIATIPRIQFSNALGVPLAGGKLYTYLAGTTTPAATYQDQALTTKNENPITLDATGACTIWLDPDKAYKFVLKNALGITQPGWPVDNISGASNLISLAPTLAQYAKLTALAAAVGSSLMGFIQPLIGAKKRTVDKKLGERVSVADFLDTETPTAAQATAALQAAINSGAKKVFIAAAYTINAGVALAANQVVDFDGGSLTMTADASAPNGVLYANGKANIKIIDPVIDASAITVVRAISLVNCTRSTVIDGLLTKSIIAFEASSNVARSNYTARGTVINLMGASAPCVYISGANGVTLSDLVISAGHEGVGIYNDARNVSHTAVHSFNQVQDGFVIIAGHRITYSNCHSYSNGQSGFTTQRQSAANNTQRVSYSACHAYENDYDGFDIRGANDGTSWNTDLIVTINGCVSMSNKGTGYYIVNAEGTMLSGCFGGNNGAQNFFVNNSNRVTISGCESSSGASGVEQGANSAGFIVYNSGAVCILGCHSSNSGGATQSYGVSFTGTSTACTVVGGYYENDIIAPFNLTLGNRFVAAQGDTGGGSIFLRGITERGIYEEEGFGIPTHARPLGSSFNRLDGGNAELYLSNGGGTWLKLA